MDGLRNFMSIAVGIAAVSIVLIGCSPDATTPVSSTPEFTTDPGTPDDFGVVAGVNLFGSPGAAIGATSLRTLTVGLPSEGQNIFPFGGHLTSVPAQGTRYQQAYASTQFDGLGPILIKSLSFLDGQAVFFPSNYALSLSTISTGINSLSNVNFDANLGADNTAFLVLDLAGPAPEVFTVTGSVPFLYDPSGGNLLLDIVVSPGGPNPGFNASFASRRGSADGVFSRFHNFGGGTLGFGLVTQFEFAGATVEDLAALVADALANGTLTGIRNTRVRMWQNLIDAAVTQSAAGNTAATCALLTTAHSWSDGMDRPPDLVTGPAAPVLAAFIEVIVQQLGC